jgi:hypothetical protein
MQSIGRAQGGFWRNLFRSHTPPPEVGQIRQAAIRNHPDHPWTGLNLVHANSHKDVNRHLQALPQRGVASTTMASANAGMFIVQHAYKSGEPQRGFLENDPPGGKLELRMTVTPSGHDGPAKAKQYASENTYVARVGFFDKGNPKADWNGFVELQKVQYDGDGLPTDQKSVQKDGPRWAATSPALTVDLNEFRKDHPGADLVLQGWPSFSAGVGGYREARETVIKV